MNLKEKTASGLLWAAMNNGMMQLLNMVIGIFLGRLLTPNDYALVGMIAIFSAIASTLQESGFTSALINNPKPSDKEYNSVFWFSIMVGVVLYSLLFACAPLIAAFFNQECLVGITRVSFLSILLSAIGIVPTAYLNKYLLVKETAIIRVSTLAISGVAGVAMALNEYAYWSLVTQQLLYVGLLSVGKFFLIPWRPSFSFDMKPIREMLGFSSKVMVTNIVNQVANNILSFIFGKLFPLRMVGNFTQSYKWNNMASSLVAGTISQVAQPVFAAMNDNPDKQLAVLRKMMRLTSLMAFPAMLGLAVVANEFIIILISDKWAGCVPMLQVLCMGGAFLPLYQPLQNLLVSRGRSDLFMWANISQLVVQIALVLLTSRHGFMFMIVVYSFVNMAWLIVWQQMVRRVVPIGFYALAKDVAPFFGIAIVACAVACLVAIPLQGLFLKLIVKLLVGAASYYIMVRACGATILKESVNYLLRRKL